MGLDYADGCVNFRDAGAYINLILEKELIPEGRIYRGGSIDYVKDHTGIQNVRSIISLRNAPDFEYFDVDYYHFPMSNKVEKYDTMQKEVRIWLNEILKIFEDENFKYPFLIHCLSGKDRTGIVVSALLLIMGIEEEVIEEEYLLSEGEVHLSLIRQAMDGMSDICGYFNRVDLTKVRANLFGT